MESSGKTCTSAGRETDAVDAAAVEPVPAAESVGSGGGTPSRFNISLNSAIKSAVERSTGIELARADPPLPLPLPVAATATGADAEAAAIYQTHNASKIDW